MARGGGGGGGGGGGERQQDYSRVEEIQVGLKEWECLWGVAIQMERE